MNFTREPIIETVITPREGCKLVVRSSKGASQEDYYVDAVEVVSFGHSFFFRSLEKPKAFLVPVSDYEILELRETRMVLKNVSSERSIKIGGGRDAPLRPREAPPREPREPSEEAPAASDEASQERSDRKQGRRRRGRRGGRDRGAPETRERAHPAAPADEEPMEEPTEGVELTEGPVSQEEQKAPSFISKLFPPPPTLIKETLGRYKTVESVESTEELQKESTEETLFEHRYPDEEKPTRDEDEFEE